MAVPIFFMPWFALELELGFSIKLSEMLMLVLIAKYLVLGKFRLRRLPGYGYLYLAVFLAIVMAHITLAYGPEVPVLKGGVLRNDYGRVLLTLVKFAILFLFLTTLISMRQLVNPLALLRIYIISCAMLAVLGLWQFATFSISGIDPFPMGFLSEKASRTASIATGLGRYLRISSFGGEPKGLGQSLAVAASLILVFGAGIGWSRRVRFATVCLLLSVVIMTFSTSAFILLLVTVGLGRAFVLNPRPLGGRSLAFTLLCIAFGVFTIFYLVAAKTDTLGAQDGVRRSLIQPADASAIGKAQKPADVGDAVLSRLIYRLRLDDTDALIMESLVGDPAGVIFGRGIGLAHYYAIDLIPPNLNRYLEGKVLPPKSGVSLYVGYSGILGLLLITGFVSGLIPSRSGAVNALPSEVVRSLCRAQALGIGIFAAHMLRIYTLEITWVIFGILHVLDCQYRTRLNPLERLARPS